MAQAATITGQIDGRRQRVEQLVSERLAEAFRAEEGWPGSSSRPARSWSRSR